MSTLENDDHCAKIVTTTHDVLFFTLKFRPVQCSASKLCETVNIENVS